MPQERLTLRKIREILRLKWECQLRISLKSHSLNGPCRTGIEGQRLTEGFYIKCATWTAAT
jgi:hypothetical protein